MQVFRGSITAAPDFDPSADAETLYNAMKGIGECPPLLPSVLLRYQQAACATPGGALCSPGSDKEAILDLITSRNNAQRQEVIAAYKNNFGKVK